MDNDIVEMKASLLKVEYQIGEVDMTLKKLSNVVTELALQKQEVAELNAKMDDHAHKAEGVLRDIDKRIIANEKRLDALELLPTKESAQKWRYIADYIFKALVAAAIGGLLIMAHIKG